ncbi:carbohydrate kinase, partial [Candidatus Falkowbacteria bacterium RIFOXYA2_FULL_47_9]
MKILVSGSLAYDKIMNFPGYFKDHILPEKIHVLNVAFVVEGLRESFGGTAGNIAYSLALLKEKPIVFACAGNDFNGYQTWLDEHNIGLSAVKIIADEKTTFASIVTDTADNQITALYPGAMKYACESEIPDVDFAIIAPGNVKDMQRLPKIFRDRNIPFIFDPGQQIGALSGEDLRNGIKGAKVFISNDYELSLLIKKTGWNEAEILKHAEIIVTTLGEKGSQIKTADIGHSIPPAKPKDESDPTGAGDAYRAGFIKGLVSGWPLDMAGRFAGTIAAYTVESHGTQTHHFSLSDVAQRHFDN